jgi:FAD/FMN-containing dehydrogenase/Fe-S oxidoreductase
MPDPAADERAGYDYTAGDVARPGMVADLRDRVDGEVRFDEYSRELYATDASAYEVRPIGVVYPTATADVAAVMDYCATRTIPVLPRGGGTSLAGQSVNEAVVLDFTRHMDALVSVDLEAGTARCQPGRYLGDLDGDLAPHGLKFAPDPAWGDKSALGGAIGNNSTGAHSLVYEKTDAYVESCEVVLADGTVTELGEVPLDELRDRVADAPDAGGDLEARLYAAVARLVDDEAEAIEEAYPDITRNVSGYNLHRLLSEAGEGDSVNLARLLAGSEGTLAVVTEATVSLEPVPATKSMALLRYEDLIDAMEDVAPILAHGPAAVEVLDDVLLDLARETEEFGDLVAEMAPEGTGAVLLVEFYADDDRHGKQQVADLLADRAPTVTAAAVPAAEAADVTETPVHALDAAEAHDEAERSRFWKLRKSGLPILLGRTSDEKHVSFIEDTAVPPGELPEFVADFRAALAENDTFASFYAHAGPGCLHVRPLVNTKTVEGVERMADIADAVTDLVVEYGGSVSGEHGDGRARTQWQKKLYGNDVVDLFRDLKTAVDPDWLLNPGQVVDPPADPADLTEQLRFSPEYDFDLGFEPSLAWDNDNGMQGMVELCHGCGGCRGPQATTGGVMCPTYRAAEEEVTSTRGRANALRQAMSGDLPDDPTDEAFLTEVLDLCIGCKGCARDCPSEVDMAKLKVEVTHEHHERHGASRRDRLFASVDRLSAIGSALAPLSNWIQRLPGSDRLAERVLGIARERSLPTFRRTSLVDWGQTREPAVPAESAERRVILFPDTYTNYSAPAVGIAAVELLEAAGVHVLVTDDVTASGRAAFSKGFLDTARERARENVETLAPAVDAGWDVVLVEPSDAVMLQSDYRDLLDGEAVDRVARNTSGICEYLDRTGLDGDIAFDVAGEERSGTDSRPASAAAGGRPGAPPSLTYHGHCHQKATTRDHHAVAVLRRAGFDVDVLDSGCCGMAGSFGYEAEHYSMSTAIGRILFDQIGNSDGDLTVAPGTSCRTQIGDADEVADAIHPVTVLADHLAD